MFKDNWSMQFSDWSNTSGTDIERGQQSKDGVPAIKDSPTLGLSDDGESQADSTESGDKSFLPTKAKIVRWYNNRGRVQKGILVSLAVLLFVISISITIGLATSRDDAPPFDSSSASEAITDRKFDDDFEFPNSLATADPTASPPPTVAPTKLGAGNTKAPQPAANPTKPPAENNSSPTTSPQAPSSNVNTPYVPGRLNALKHGLLLSEGLDARIIALADQKVIYETKPFGRSKDKFHKFPDAGATFPDESGENDGGWIYVSNSEGPNKQGGVGALTFDKLGNTVEYNVLLKGSTLNKGGGATPFGTWVSCEENGKKGKIFQVDPTGERKPKQMTIGSEGGSWESFAYDIRNPYEPRFFVTEDAKDGALQRFTPNAPDWNKPWEMLHKKGKTDYLMLVPDGKKAEGRFVWTKDRDEARTNAALHYPHTEGLDVHESKMYFICKEMKQLFVLDLDTGTYFNQTTAVGLFDGSPDQVKSAAGTSRELLYFTEDSASNVNAGVHARDHSGKFYTVLESKIFEDETTGLAFSPDGRFMYIAYQTSGVLYAVWRTDGFAFHHETLHVDYHGQIP